MWKFTSCAVLLMWFAVVVKGQSEDPTFNPGGSDVSQGFTHPDSTQDTPTTTTESVDSASGLASEATEPPPCTFSETELVGDWLSALWGEVSITESKVKLDFDVGGHSGIRTLQCYASSGDGEYVLRSEDPYMYHRIPFYLYTCIKFDKRNEDNFHLTVKTERHEDSNNEPVEAKPESYEIRDPLKEICNSSFEVWTKGDLLRKGREIDGSLGCSDKLKGVFNVTYTNELTQRKCEGGAIMTSCDEPKTLVFNYTTCSESASEDFSGEDKYVCVGGSSDKVLLYRDSTEQNMFTPFSCLTIIPMLGSDATSELSVTHQSLGCDPTWQASTQIRERFTLTPVDDCEEDVPEVTTQPTELENTTVAFNDTSPFNETTTTEMTIDNTTISGNGSGSSNITDDSENLAPSLGSNGILVTFIVAIFAILLNEYAGLDL